ncbi:MAG TPA: hypothetical protein VN256_12855 [Pyrinomonadaceae bacterium]|nr:hypothetical protein [Pyrinomonadaceae bacterium]
MPILNYTTKVNEHKTIGEIQKALVAKGALSVMTDYTPSGTPAAVTFTINVNGTPIRYRLPSDVDGVLRAMQRAKGVPYRLQTREQAVRVCWRILKDWIEAQLAIIEAGQAELAQVFLPYALNSEGQTLFEYFRDNPRLLTEGGRKLLPPHDDPIDAEVLNDTEN